MSLTSEYDLQGLGPKQGKPVVVAWPWTNHLWSLLPLGLLLLPALLARNRSLGAAAVWLPVLALYFCWIPFTWMFDGIPGELEMILGVFAVGLGVTCSLLPWITTGRWLTTWLLALSVAVGVECLAYACFSASDLDLLSIWRTSLLLPACGTLIVVTSSLLAARACRRRISSGRFFIRLLLWLAICSVTTVFAVVFGQGLLMGTSDVVRELAFVFLFSALTLVLVCLAAIVPFLLLGLFSSIYRERFLAVLTRG